MEPIEQELTAGLYIVATPIGNLADISARAVMVLKEVDLVLAEDTRHSRILLNHIDVNTRTESYNDFNKEKRTSTYLSFLQAGNKVALICDAGTPGVADAAFYIVRAARQAGIPVIPIPGPVAFITALVASGLPTDRFMFCNFPPKKSAQRTSMLQLYRDTFLGGWKHPPTLCFYIGPKQLIKFINEIAAVYGEDIRIVLGRELTKKFEEFLDKSAVELLTYYNERKPKGEYVLMFHPGNKG
ncbi:MAG: 16S rRNA (cytidine(1402)-2'-O)-methyltransferase [Fibrobacteria bacterium]|nr:16S rRNA (cytidine(1402)-2'-O)-methyltransferase [Fibrobacteria bacterium]